MDRSGLANAEPVEIAERAVAEQPTVAGLVYLVEIRDAAKRNARSGVENNAAVSHWRAVVIEDFLCAGEVRKNRGGASSGADGPGSLLVSLRPDSRLDGVHMGSETLGELIYQDALKARPAVQAELFFGGPVEPLDLVVVHDKRLGSDGLIGCRRDGHCRGDVSEGLAGRGYRGIAGRALGDHVSRSVEIDGSDQAS